MSRSDDILRAINRSVPTRLSDQYFITRKIEPTLFNKIGRIQVAGPRNKDDIVKLFKKMDDANCRISQWINQEWVDIE